MVRCGCCICGFEVGGIRYQKPDIPNAPILRFCSMACSDLAFLSVNARGELDLKELTDMEQKAIRSARAFLADALAATGLMDKFQNANAQQIDTIIEACWRGCRQGMAEQDSIPF